VLDHLANMKQERPDDYRAFWGQFGMVVKEGLASDPEQRERLLPLLVFSSSADGEKPTDLAGYVERMGTDQESIYYLTGERRDLLEDSPHAEGLRAAGREILYLTDPIDEFVVGAIGEYEGHRLRSAALAEAEGGRGPEATAADGERDGDAAAASTVASPEAEDGSLEALRQALYRRLQDEVRAVRLSERLTTSAARLVGGESDLSPRLERILRQAQGEAAVPRSKRTLEINPDHEIARRLARRVAAGAPDNELDLAARLLLDYARLAEGTEIDDPSGLRQRLGELLLKSLA
jgi:molecular chaperone HtpG